MNQLRILVLAPDANPESISVSLVCYLHAEALARLHRVTLVGRSWHEGALRRAKGNTLFQALEAIKVPWLDSIYTWSLRRIFRYNFRSNLLTAFSYPFAIAFEWAAWRHFRSRIKAGEFDVILRLSPIIAVIPSAFPFLLRSCSIPFIIGPINGGLPWPQGFSQADNQKRWFDKLRKLYRYLPFTQSTYRRAAAIIAGSSQTYAEFSHYRNKLFFIPENGISSSLCSDTVRPPRGGRKLEFIFVGGLVPYKACDLALRAAAPFLRSGAAHFSVAGDGPERERLERLAGSLEIKEAVTFCGTLSHSEAMERLRLADVLIFPSVREFGGGVVFEALAVGAVPVVADFGGPGDIVRPEVGYKVPLTNESDVVSEMERILADLVANQDLLNRLGLQAMSYARECLTWEAKVESVTRIMYWVMGQTSRPDLPPPKVLEVVA